jgi:FtsZ-binding cell division protein ZapB
MTPGVVLNHHALPFANVEVANKGLLQFLKTLKTCRASGLKVLLLDEDQDKSLMRLELAAGYCVSDWFAWAGKDALLTDWRRLLRSLETRQPLFETLDAEVMQSNLEVGLPGEPTGNRVLLAAYVLQTFLISFSTQPKWLAPTISVWILDISEEVKEKEDSLLNLVDDKSLAFHKEDLLRRRNEQINSARDIWNNRQEWFPHLTLLSNQIGSSLQNWSARQAILLKACDALNVLERFCAKWRDGEYSDYRHAYLNDLGLAAEVSGESSSVGNDPKKKKARMFWLEDGREVYCENHIKLPGGYRLHYFPDPEQKHIYVAYLGPHLPI